MSKDTEKFDKHTLKDDEVGDALLVFINKLKERKIPIIATFVIIVVLLVGYNASKDYKNSKLTDISEKLAKARASYEEAVQGEFEDKSKESYEKAIKQYQEVIDEHPTSNGGIEALYLQGNCYYEMKDFDNAKAAYNKYVAKVTDPAEKANAYLSLGYTFENQFFYTNKEEFLKSAMENYEQAIKAAKETYMKYQAMMSLGRCYELTNKDQEALDLYKKIIAEKPKSENSLNSPYAMFNVETTVKDKIEKLEASLQAKK